MGSFTVDLDRLRAVPGMLDRLTETATACRRYAELYFTFELGPGLVNRVTGRHAEVLQQVRHYFDDIATQAGERGRAVATCITYYESVDAEAAARFDALNGTWSAAQREGRSPVLLPDLPQADYLEPNRPEQELLTPPDYTEPYQPAFTDVVSPGSLTRDAVWGVTSLGAKVGLLDRPHDPYDDVVMPLTGDYTAMHRLGDALHHLAAAAWLMSANADWIALRIESCWLGNAADQAWLAIRHLALALTPARPILDELGQAYLDVVAEMKEVTDLAEMALNDLIDAAFFGIAAAATVETFVGPILLGGALAVEIIEACAKMNDLLTYLARANTAIDLWEGRLTGVGMLPHDLPHLPEVPTG